MKEEGSKERICKTSDFCLKPFQMCTTDECFKIHCPAEFPMDGDIANML